MQTLQWVLLQYGECVRHLNVRINEHTGTSPLIKKQVKPKSSSIANHLLFCNHSASYDNFSILKRENKKFLLELKRNLLIMRDNHLWIETLHRHHCTCSIGLSNKIFVRILFAFKDTHMASALTNRTQALMRSMNMSIWVISTLNQLFRRGSYTEIKFSKKWSSGKTPLFMIGLFCTTKFYFCLNIGFWKSSFAWKCGVFHGSNFN